MMSLSVLLQRVGEIQKVIDVLESLDQGSLMQNFNSVTGRASLDTKFFQQQLDLNHIAMHGHSFGGATAIATSGVDKRIKCCLAEDVWWEPLEEV
jgi:platelet-activating factor acetylhydrolase